MSAADLMKLADLRHGGFYAHFDGYLQKDRKRPICWLAGIRGSQKEARHAAIGTRATMTGSIVLACTTDSSVLSEDILEAGRRAVSIQVPSRNKCIQQQRISGS